jgi:N-acetylneuraminic acid mutarotase
VPNFIRIISVLFIFIGLPSCEEKLSVNNKKDVILTGNAQSIVKGGWRKMGDFFNDNAVYKLLFVLRGKAYFKVSMNYQDLESDFWAYDPISNSFSARKELPTKDGGELYMAIGDKGYYGPGLTFYAGDYTDSNEFWQYNPDIDTWERKADFIANEVDSPGVFVIGDQAYVCGWQEKNGLRQRSDVYQYNSVTNVWSKKQALYPLNEFLSTQLQFGVDGKGYLFGGRNGRVEPYSLVDSLYTTVYNPSNDSFSSLRNITFPYKHAPQTSWVSNNSIYMYCGGVNHSSANFKNEIWEFNVNSSVWRKREDFGGSIRTGSFAFAIDGKFYICFGQDNGVHKNDIWEYNP